MAYGLRPCLKKTTGSGDVAQLVEYLSRVQFPRLHKTGMVVGCVMLALRRERQEGQKVKVILHCIVQGQPGIHETPK